MLSGCERIGDRFETGDCFIFTGEFHDQGHAEIRDPCDYTDKTDTNTTYIGTFLWHYNILMLILQLTDNNAMLSP